MLCLCLERHCTETHETLQLWLNELERFSLNTLIQTLTCWMTQQWILSFPKESVNQTLTKRIVERIGESSGRDREPIPSLTLTIWMKGFIMNKRITESNTDESMNHSVRPKIHFILKPQPAEQQRSDSGIFEKYWTKPKHQTKVSWFMTCSERLNHKWNVFEQRIQ